MLNNVLSYVSSGPVTASAATGNQAVTVGSTFGTTPTGYAPMGMNGISGSPYFYVPAGFTLLTVLDNGASAASGSATVIYDVFAAGSGISETTVFSAAVGALNNVYFATNTALVSGWYRPVSITAGGSSLSGANRLMCIVYSSGTYTAATKTLALGTSAVTALLPAVIAPGVSTSAVPFSSTRVTSLAALFTNVTKALNKEGTVLAGRLNAKTTNYFDFTAASFSQLHPSEKYFYGLEEGMYTYMPLSSDPYDFVDHVWNQVPWTGQAIPCVNLAQDAHPHAIVFADPDGGTSLAVNVDWHLEFRNTSVLWPVGVSGITLEALHQAQLGLLSSGFFFNNVDHNRILSWITKGIRALKPFSGLHPVLGVGIHGAEKVLSSMTQKKVQPTTLAVRVPGKKVSVKKPKKKPSSRGRAGKKRK
jgi:hypothetical protein